MSCSAVVNWNQSFIMLNIINLQIACADNVSQTENLKAVNRHSFNTAILRDLCYYLIRKPCYPGENGAMPPRLRYLVHFLLENYSASRGRPCDSTASCYRAIKHNMCTGLLVSSPARRPIPRVNDQSSFSSLYMSPSALGRSGWPGCATDKNSWLWSTKLFSRWSVSVEQSAAGNEDDITDTRAVL